MPDNCNKDFLRKVLFHSFLYIVTLGIRGEKEKVDIFVDLTIGINRLESFNFRLTQRSQYYCNYTGRSKICGTNVRANSYPDNDAVLNLLESISFAQNKVILISSE